MSTTYSQAWRAIVISNHSVREKQHCCVSPLCYYNTPYFCTPVTKCVGVSFTLSNSLILGRFQLGVLQFSSVLTPFSWDSIRSHKTVLISDALPKSRLSPVFLNNQYNHVLSCQVVICENKLLVQLVTQSHKCFSLGNHSALVCSSSVHFFFFLMYSRSVLLIFHIDNFKYVYSRVDKVKLIIFTDFSEIFLTKLAVFSPAPNAYMGVKCMAVKNTIVTLLYQLPWF